MDLSNKQMIINMHVCAHHQARGSPLFSDSGIDNLVLSSVDKPKEPCGCSSFCKYFQYHVVLLHI